VGGIVTGPPHVIKLKGGKRMLTITVGAIDVYDDETGKFGSQGGFELQLEHSLLSLSKWESIHEKAFLEAKERTTEETLSYVECMLLTPNPPGDFLLRLSEKNFEEIHAYIDRKMTATWFSEVEPQTRNKDKVTAEVLYYWMTVFNIPFECQHWHLNRLLTLIRICNIKQGKPKKMSRGELARRNRELNEQRKAKYRTTG
jgi:hypothetical protein